METEYKIIVDTTSNFSINRVTTGRKSVRSGGTENIDYDTDIDAYQCEDDGGENSCAYNPRRYRASLC